MPANYTVCVTKSLPRAIKDYLGKKGSTISYDEASTIRTSAELGGLSILLRQRIIQLLEERTEQIEQVRIGLAIIEWSAEPLAGRKHVRIWFYDVARYGENSELATFVNQCTQL